MKMNTKIEYELVDAGLDINTHRFPYTYHHDYIRRPGMSRSDIAQKLREVSADMDEYDYSACYGAILYLISEQPEKINDWIVSILENVRAGSVYNVNVDGVCGLARMREIMGI